MPSNILYTKCDMLVESMKLKPLSTQELDENDTYCFGRNMRQIGGDTRGIDNIVECELFNIRMSFEKKRERLVEGSLLVRHI